MDKRKVEEFKQAVCNLCKQYSFSIGHEDSQGGFLIEPYKEENITWFMQAMDKTEPKDS